MLSVAVACTTGTSLYGSRYQGQRRLCSMRYSVATMQILNQVFDFKVYQWQVSLQLLTTQTAKSQKNYLLYILFILLWS